MAREDLIGATVSYNGKMMVVMRLKYEAGQHWVYLAPAQGRYGLEDIQKVSLAGLQELRQYVYRD